MKLIRDFLKVVVLIFCLPQCYMTQSSIIAKNPEKVIDSLGKLSTLELAENATEGELNLLLYNDLRKLYDVRKIQVQLAKKKKDIERLDFVLCELGRVESALGKHKEARLKLMKALESCKRRKDYELTAKCSQIIGNTYYSQENFLKALKYYKMTIEQSKGIKDENLRISIQGDGNSMLGLIYVYLDMIENAKAHIKIALKNFERVNNRPGIAYCYGALAECHLQQEDFPNALRCGQKRLRLTPKGSKLNEAYAKKEIGHVQRKMNDKKAAIMNLKEALDLFEELGEQFSRANCYNELALCYFEEKYDLDSAFVYAEKALKLSKKRENARIFSESANVLYHLYKDRGNSVAALEMNELYQKYRAISERIEEKEQVKLEFIREKFKKQEEKIRLAQEKEMAEERNRRIKSALLMIIPLISGLVFISFQLRKMKLNRREHEELLKKLSAMQKSLNEDETSEEVSSIKRMLDRVLIAEYTNDKINHTDWSILEHLSENPSSTNKKIAESIHMSYDAVLSSLKKMYKLFGIDVKSNHKLQLLVKVSEISTRKYAS